MASIDGPQFPGIEDGLIFCWDPKNRDCWVGGTNFTDLKNDITGSSVNIEGDEFDGAITTEGYIDFDGTDDYVDISAWNADSDIGDGNAVTLDAWFNPDVEGQMMMFSCHGGNPTRFYIETYGTGGSFVAHWGFGSNQNSATSTAVVTTGTWYNYVATYDGDNINGYLNGVLDDTVTGVGSLEFNNSNLRLGIYGTDFDWDGKLGPLQIYNRALSATEILTNYNRLKGRFGL